MFSTLDVDIRPGSGIGMFEIGSSLWSVIDMLRGLQHYFPLVDVKYDPDTSLTTPVILHLRPHFDLLFSGHHQRLHTICLTKLREVNPPVTIRYRDSILSSPDKALIRVQVSRTFGPTYPGDDLRYPGVWFSFEDEVIDKGLKDAEHHAEIRTQEVKRVFVSEKCADGEERDALDEVRECPAMHGDIFRAVIKVHEGINLYFYPSTMSSLQIRMGETTAQDLNIDLGPPSRVHYKEDERMTIHSTDQPDDNEGSGDYFYNYFQHGIDFLISGQTHTVRKIILHTNVPGTPLFQRYQRCPWELEAKPEDDEDDSPPRMHFYDKFESISRFLSPRNLPPSMLLDRTDEDEGMRLPSSSTRLYGYDGIILEVSKASQVVTAMLF